MRKKEIAKNVSPVGTAAKKKTKRPVSYGEKWLLFSSFILLLIMIIYIGTQCGMEKIVVNGNQTYTKDEVEASIRNNMAGNTVVFSVAGAVMKNDYLPFIDDMEVTYVDQNTVLVEVSEKLRAGIIEENGEYFYFDKDGVIRENGTRRIKNVPIVTGLQMNNCILNEKIEPKESGVFAIILKMTQLITKYEISVTEISFNTISDIRLKCGGLQIRLGNSEELDAKMAELPGVIESLYGRQGIVNMESFTEANKIISYEQKQ